MEIEWQTIDFTEPRLVDGSWVKVQVEFYDHLFRVASKMCPHHWNQQAILAGEFSDGSDAYDRTITAIEGAFDSPAAAWRSFIEAEELHGR